MRLFISIFSLVIIQLSCTDPTFNDVFNPCGDLTKGTFITSEMETNYLTLLFSKTTNELFAAGRGGIHVINLSDNTLSNIDTTDDVNYIQLSNDGTKLFYILSGLSLAGESRPLYSISIDGTERQLLVEDVFISTTAFLYAYSCFRISPDDQKVIYTGENNSLYLYDIQGNSVSSLNIYGLPLVFSPDSKNLIFQYDSSDYSMINIETELAQQIDFNTGTNIWHIYGFFWNESGLSICYGPKWYECCYHNLTTNECIYSWKQMLYYDDYYFSEDGKKAIVWWGQMKLYLIDVIAQAETIVACGDLWEARSTTNLAISHDESLAAYAFGSSIYITDLL